MILDAVQFALVGGQRDVKFNQAAMAGRRRITNGFVRRQAQAGHRADRPDLPRSRWGRDRGHRAQHLLPGHRGQRGPGVGRVQPRGRVQLHAGAGRAVS